MNEKLIEQKELYLDDIDIGERARIDYDRIEELAGDIKRLGLIQPIAVFDKQATDNWNDKDIKEEKSDRRYLLLAGGRRMTAFNRYKLSDKIPCRIYSELLTADEIKEIELMENISRLDLKWDERIKLEKQLHELQVRLKGKAVSGSKEGHSMEQTGEMVGKSKYSISKDIKLAEALERLPELGRAKTKQDAEKILKKLGKHHTTKKRAEEINKRRSDTPVDNQRKKLIDAFSVMDFFEGIKKVPDGTISFVELDPPYAIALQDEKKGGKHNHLTYNEILASDYPDFMHRVFRECFRVMKPDSWIVTWFGPDPWFSLTQEWMKEAGFHTRALPGIWVKGRGQTQRPYQYLANGYEMFFYGSKGRPQIEKAGRVNTFSYPPVDSDKKVHITERPVEMIQDVVSTFCSGNGIGLVPFLGSGNTILAMSNIGMEGFGFDLSQEHKDSFIVNVEKSKPGEYKSYPSKGK